MPPTLHHQLIEAVRGYKMPASATELLVQYKPLIISGVTAAGKDTILSYIESSSQWRHSVTHTTRSPRAGEVDGINYWFVNEESMLELLKNQSMIEAQTIHGNTVYGTSLKAYRDVLSQGHKPLLRIDIQGIKELTNHIPDLRATFILPPSFEEWMQRIERRGRMSHIEKIQRLRSAQTEIKEALLSRHFIFIVNKDVPTAASEIINSVTDGPTQHHNRELANRLIDSIAHY